MIMLKESKGNMYEFITHTWNPIVGRCPHDCKYCYVLYKYGNDIKDGIRLEKECFKDNFGSNKFIFVGSGIDMFATASHKLPLLKVVSEQEMRVLAHVDFSLPNQRTVRMRL